MSSVVSDPWARMWAQVNEAGTRLQSALRVLRDKSAAQPADEHRARFEPLERRSLLSGVVTSSDTIFGVESIGSLRYAADDAAVASPGSPHVSSTTPADGATDVLRDAFVSANLLVPSGGIDSTTIGVSTVKLYRTNDGAAVPSSVNTTAGGDALALQPNDVLDPDTDYTFEVTSGLRDVSGNAFVPFVTHFRTGTGSSATDPSLTFTKVSLTTPKAPYTGVTVGPDGRVYAGTELGDIVRFDIQPDGTLANPQVIHSLVDANGGQPRLLTGIQFDPASTKDDLALWVTHSAYAIDNGPDWAGKVTRLSGPDLATVQDYVVGLPRSTRDHVTNQLVFGPDGAIYFPQASNTAMGAPDYAWHYRPERLLSAAILRLNVWAVRDRLVAGKGPLNVQTEDGNAYDPWAAGAPLTVYASGVRNAYDLVFHSNGSLYAPTNGSQNGGATPAGGPDNVPGIGFVADVEDDVLFRIDQGGYYGHPDPARGQYVYNGGNPTDAADPNEVSQYPVGVQPDVNWRQPAYDLGQHYSPNGVIEYRGGAFGGALDHAILVARFSGGNDVAVLTVGPNGEITGYKGGLEGLKNFNDPVDLAEDPRTGFLYVAEYGGERITLAKPTVGGTPPGVKAPSASAPLGPIGLSVRASGRGELELNWTDTVGESGYKIERSSDGGDAWTQVGTTGTNDAHFVDTGLTPNRTYSFRVRAASDAGNSKATAVVTAATLAVTLPPGWSADNVGDVAVGGTGDEQSGVFQIGGGGAGLGDTADALFFASVPASGDFEVVTRVSAADAGATAGVMLRAGTDAGATGASMAIGAEGAAVFQVRESAGAAATRVQAAQGASWLRLVRRSDLVSGYVSADGTNWIRVAFARVALGDILRAGIVVASGNRSAAADATFDNLRINAAPALSVPEQPSELTTVIDGSSVTLAWRDNSQDETGFEIQRRRNGADAWLPVGSSGANATSYVDEHLAAARKYDYRVVATNATGPSVASNEVEAKTPKTAAKGQVPFSGAPMNLPGVVEVEAFDDGARGKAWKDRTPDNDMGAFRDAGADIEPTTDPTGGDYQVVAAKSEWMEYTVAAPTAGFYTVSLRYAAASGFGGTARVDVDGVKKIAGVGSIDLPATGSWDVWQTANGLVNLKAGVQVIRLYVDSSANPSGDAASLNYMTFAPADPATLPVSAPLKRAAKKAKLLAARTAELLPTHG
jgi:hypothetical protein